MPRSHGTGRIRFDPLKIREVRCSVHMKACKPQEHLYAKLFKRYNTKTGDESLAGTVKNLNSAE